MSKKIDKSKLVFSHDDDFIIKDQPLETIEIGYYKDSWNRFKKNKASLVAFIIICFIFFLVIFGPSLKKYTLPQDNKTDAQRFQFLTPKIPGLEKLGIFDGTKKLTVGKEFLLHMAQNEYGEGIILSGLPQELIDNPNHPDYANVSDFVVKVDYYKFVNYTISYMPIDYFGIIKENEKNGTNKDPNESVKIILTKEQFEEYLEKNYIIELLDIIESKDINDPSITNYQYIVKVDRFKQALNQLPEDTYFWFGTNERGEDLFIEIWKGARISLIMAILVLIVNTSIGLVLGSIVGYYGGVLDLLFDRFVEIVSSIPFMTVITLLTLRFGTELWVVVIAFTATGWIGSYGTGRMQFYRFKNREYVLAARTLGASDARIMVKHIFPNTLGLIVTGYALAIPAFVFTEASYSFLGIINYKDATSVGMLIDQGQKVMQLHPHVLLFPSLYIAILMIAFNLFGNGLRDAFNPSLRGVE